MKRVPCLFLCIILQLLAQSVEALNEAGAAELTFYFQAYLLEWEHVTDETRRAIAPGCAAENGGKKCTFAEFVDHVSSNKAKVRNSAKKEVFNAIFDDAEKNNTPLVETSRKLREAGFRAEYDQTTLYPKDKEARSSNYAIRKMRGIAAATKKNKYADQKRKMIEALELSGEVRRADNMPFFITELQKELGVTMETEDAKTSDGLEYKMYNEAKTAEKNGGIEDLGKKIGTAADKLRKAKRTDMSDDDGRKFAIHQGAMRELKESITQLKQKCP
jgi:uncharacterized protein YihD (DUF1040 family)